MNAPVIEFRPLDGLAAYARNARTHSDEQVSQLMGAMLEFGWTNPVLADDNGIVAGHGRCMAARKLYAQGKTIKLPDGTEIPPGSVPVVDCAGWSDAKRRAYILWDNKSALNAGWDMTMLALELQDLDTGDIDLSLTGFSEKELEDLLTWSPDGAKQGLTDPDDAPEVQEQHVSQHGDVWILGNHRLMNGDSTKAGDIKTLCSGQLVDMWLTDPPYNVAYEGKTKDALKIKNDAMGDDAFRAFLRDAFVAADASMKPGAVFYIWHADSEGYNFRGACRDAGWQVRQCLIWQKQTLVMGRQDYHWKHEPCLYGWKDGAGHLWAADRKQTTLLEFDRPSRNGEHPTMKPVALFEYQMLNNTKGGDLVLDSFGGSGTTAIACERHGRFARLMELDPRYCDVIILRWQAFTGQHAHLEADGRTFTEVMGERAPGKLVGNETGQQDKKAA